MLTVASCDVFQRYAQVYDALYRDKDYDTECDFLNTVFRQFGKTPIKRVLDLGCGTGGHSIPLARMGYSVIGIDRSVEMLKTARRKADTFNLDGNLKFKTGDIQTAECQGTFDAVLCMFAVLSYQVSNAELTAVIANARQHLPKGGLFIADFWYGPGVLCERPSERIKDIRVGNDRIIRLVMPVLNSEENIVEVKYRILKFEKNRLIGEIQETHNMRYLFKPELEYILTQSQFTLEHFGPFGQLHEKLSEAHWNAMFVARAV